MIPHIRPQTLAGFTVCVAVAVALVAVWIRGLGA